MMSGLSITAPLSRTILDLPDDVFGNHILPHLKLHELCAFSLTCRQLHLITNLPVFWQKMYNEQSQRLKPPPSFFDKIIAIFVPKPLPEIDYKKAFIQQYQYEISLQQNYEGKQYQPYWIQNVPKFIKENPKFIGAWVDSLLRCTKTWPTKIENSDADTLYMVVHALATRNWVKTSRNMKSYGIIDKERRYTLATMKLESDGWEIAEFLPYYDLDKEQLIKIAKIAATLPTKVSNYRLSWYLKYYFKITAPEQFAEIRTIVKAHEPWLKRLKNTPLENFSNLSEEQRYEAAIQKAISDGYELSQCIECLEIKDDERRHYLATIVSQYYYISPYVERFQVLDENLRFFIACREAKSSGGAVVNYHIGKYAFTDEKKRYKLAKILAGKDGQGVRDHLADYDIKDPLRRGKILKIADDHIRAMNVP